MIEVIANSKATSLARLWRQQHHRIGFVNGCFDVLHAGHLHLLSSAKRLCTRLIVAVNADDYCRRKGSGRPIQPAGLRALIAGSVVDAHAATVFSGNDPSELLSGILPDVYIMGSDYQDREIPGECHCGEMVFIDRLPGESTTRHLERLVQGNSSL